MANVINTRIQLKYDSFSNWTTNNPTLLQGEIAIAYVGEAPTKEVNSVTAPQVLFKVGPGAFNSLPWASALAADVYPWAKQSENDFVKNFLTLKMTDGTTMQSKLDAVFATDAELAAAIADLRKEIPAKLGVMSITTSDDDVVILNKLVKADGDVTITAAHKKVTKADDDTKTATPAHEGTFAAVTGVAYDDYGHVSGVETTTFTLPEDENTTYKLEVVKDPSTGKITFTPSEGNANSIYFNGLDSIYVNSANGTINFSINANDDFGRDSNNSSQLALSKAVHDSLALADTAVQPDDLGDLAAKDNITHDLVTDFDTAVAAVKVANAGHADTATTATTATTADKVAKALTVGSKTYDGSNAVEVTAADLGLESAMHFIGALSAAPDSANPGDVYLNTATKKEYVYDKTNGWIELGDEGSYALRSITITGTDGLTGGGDLTKNQTISHAVPTGAAAGSVGGTNSDMKFVAAITTDKFGHVTNKTEKTLDLSRFVLKDFDIKAGDGLTGGGAINGTDITISHANTSDVTNVTKAARTYVTGMTFDQFGHVTAVETASETDQDLSNYKIKQTAVVDPTSEGEAVDFIATIAQDANGNITATKKHVDFSNYVSLVYADGNYKKKQTAYTYTKGAEKIITKIEQNANGEITVTEGALTTDDIAGGTETWFFYCGTATEVMDTKPTV